jgi:hypothetical protein
MGRVSSLQGPQSGTNCTVLFTGLWKSSASLPRVLFAHLCTVPQESNINRRQIWSVALFSILHSSFDWYLLRLRVCRCKFNCVEGTIGHSVRHTVFCVDGNQCCSYSWRQELWYWPRDHLFWLQVLGTSPVRPGKGPWYHRKIWLHPLPFTLFPIRLLQRFSNCGPRIKSGPRVLPLWSS